MRLNIVLLLAFVLVQCYADENVKSNTIEEDSSPSDSYGFGNCEDSDTSLSCQSLRIARNVLQQFMKAKSANTIGDVKIVDGVDLIKTHNLADGGRNIAEGSMFVKIARFLQNHELRVKLPELVGKSNMEDVITKTLASVDEQSKLVETGRKKGGKGGGGGVLLMALMMAKTLAAIGFGGVGMLTMKALMISSLALMLSAIIGVKKLASSGHDDHGGGHQVIYATGHGEHHRRRRSFMDKPKEADVPPYPYKGWGEYILSN